MVLEVKSPPSSGLLNLEKGKGEKKGGGGGCECELSQIHCVLVLSIYLHRPPTLFSQNTVTGSIPVDLSSVHHNTILGGH